MFPVRIAGSARLLFKKEMLGLKRGAVLLCDHEREWELEAARTIDRLKAILGDVIKGIEHVGSTSIPAIKAKPIIDIALGVERFENILVHEAELRDAGFYYRSKNDTPTQKLWACGSYYDGSGDLQTHFIHVVIHGGREWTDYINFRNYLNKTPWAAREYEALKLGLSGRAREEYTPGKHDFIVYTLRKALVDSYLGEIVDIEIDRPLGSVHPKHPNIVYPVNYGYIPNVYGGDGEELDVYLLGIEEPFERFTARVIGIVHRRDDVEDKLIAAPDGIKFTKSEIESKLYFQEQYYNSDIELI